MVATAETAATAGGEKEAVEEEGVCMEAEVVEVVRDIWGGAPVGTPGQHNSRCKRNRRDTRTDRKTYRKDTHSGCDSDCCSNRTANRLRRSRSSASSGAGALAGSKVEMVPLAES